MPTLTVTKNYADGTDLTESQLDDIKSSIETFVNTTKLDADNIQALAITTGLIANTAVTAAKLATNSVETAKIKDANVTTAKIALDAIDGTLIADDAVDSEHYTDGSVDQVHLAARAVTTDGTDPGAGGVCISASSGTYSRSTGSYGDVNNLACTLTTTGRPVRVELISDASGNPAYVGDASTTNGTLYLKFLRDSTNIGEFQYNNFSTTTIWQGPCSMVATIDAPSAGTYVFKLQAKGSVTENISVYYSKLVAYEL